jgi:hypothetical protein
MKKRARRLLLLVPAVCYFSLSLSQTTGKLQNGKEKEVIISITGIEYDDAGFSALRETVKKNSKAKSIRQSYNDGTAKISMLYPGSAADLWDEMPALVKQPFKLTSIDNARITLDLKTTPNQAQTVRTVSAETKAPSASDTKTGASSTLKNSEACTTCYIDLCKYDKTRTFVGVTYIGIDYDEGTYYYRCENGMLIRKLVWVNENGVTTKIETDTILKVNVPVGTYWGTTTGDAQNNTSDIRLIVAKGITVEVDGKVYKDVIVVNRRKTSRINFLVSLSDASSLNAYYAKGAGIIKIQQLESNADPLTAIQQFVPKMAAMQASNESVQIDGKTLKGKIDPTITGLWKYTDANGKITFLKFNTDGTSDSYNGQVSTTNANKSRGYWRVDGGAIEFTWDGYKKVERYDLQKSYDAASGKPTLAVGWATYVAADNRTSW